MRALFLILVIIALEPLQVEGAGFVGPGAHEAVTLAADVLQAKDDVPCILEGHIMAKVAGRKNRYFFKDSSGTVVVEIKRKLFGQRTVTPETLLRLEGEVETSKKYPNEMEVDSLEILR